MRYLVSDSKAIAQVYKDIPIWCRELNMYIQDKGKRSDVKDSLYIGLRVEGTPDEDVAILFHLDDFEFITPFTIPILKAELGIEIDINEVSFDWLKVNDGVISIEALLKATAEKDSVLFEAVQVVINK